MVKKMASLLALVLSLSMAAFPALAAGEAEAPAAQESLVVEPETVLPENPFVGSWEVQSVTMNGSVIPVEQVLQSEGLTANVADNGTVTLLFSNGFTASVVPVYSGRAMVVQYKELGNDMVWIVTLNEDGSATAIYDVYSIALKLTGEAAEVPEAEAAPVESAAAEAPAVQESLVVEPEAPHEGNPFAGVWKVQAATMNSSEIPVSQILQADDLVAVVAENGSVTLLFSNDVMATLTPSYGNGVMTFKYADTGMTWNVVINEDGTALALYNEYSIRLSKVQ